VPVASNTQALNIAVAKGDLPLSSKLLEDLGIQKARTKEVILSSQFRKDIKEMVEDLEEIKAKDKREEGGYSRQEFERDLVILGDLTKQLKQKLQRRQYSPAETKAAIEKAVAKKLEDGELFSGKNIETALKLKILKTAGVVATADEIDGYFDPAKSPFNAETGELIRKLSDTLMAQFQKRNQ
jgi:hypothetical protein